VFNETKADLEKARQKIEELTNSNQEKEASLEGQKLELIGLNADLASKTDKVMGLEQQNQKLLVSLFCFLDAKQMCHE
jgi:hypothetical protein